MSIIDPEWLKAHPSAVCWRVTKTKGITGYPAPPGTGPKGETCKTCENLCAKHMASTYYKCVVMKSAWSGGGGTDVKVRSPACSYWKPRVVTEGEQQTTARINMFR